MTRRGAYPVSGLLGYAYFVVITSLSTVLQEHLEDAQRGRVMALWIMGFGGTVPLGVLVAGWVGERRVDHDRGARRLRLGDRARGLVGSRSAAEEGGQ